MNCPKCLLNIITSAKFAHNQIKCLKNSVGSTKTIAQSYIYTNFNKALPCQKQRECKYITKLLIHAYYCPI